MDLLKNRSGYNFHAIIECANDAGSKKFKHRKYYYHNRTMLVLLIV